MSSKSSASALSPARMAVAWSTRRIQAVRLFLFQWFVVVLVLLLSRSSYSLCSPTVTSEQRTSPSGTRRPGNISTYPLRSRRRRFFGESQCFPPIKPRLPRSPSPTPPPFPSSPLPSYSRHKLTPSYGFVHNSNSPPLPRHHGRRVVHFIHGDHNGQSDKRPGRDGPAICLLARRLPGDDDDQHCGCVSARFETLRLNRLMGVFVVAKLRRSPALGLERVLASLLNGWGE